jgi:signal-transduction protein with cAMP-binding, CBS, and nucleotidyltransferase domain
VRKVLLIFSELTDGDVEWLSKAGDRIHLEKGAVLVPNNSRVENLYFVLDGRLAIRSAKGDLIRMLESGEVIGEMSLVDPAPTVVSVEIDADATLLRIPDARVREKLAADFPFAARFYRALCVFLADRIRTTTARMGYGTGVPDPHAGDELNDDMLDSVHLAGARFDRMLKRLAG